MDINSGLSVTVIMVVRNEESFIAQSLGSVLRQDYPVSLIQILVVDGVSQDNTRRIVQQLQQAHPKSNLSLLDNPKGIFPTGFNIGLQNSISDVILMMGGHTILELDYVFNCVDHLENHPDIDCVGGYLTTISQTDLGRAISLAMSSVFGVGGVSFRTHANQLKEVDTVAFGAYRRRAIERCGMMDEELVRDQDDEYNYRLREKGGRILISPYIRASYFSRSSITSLWSQYFEYGYWKVRVAQKHPRQMRLRHFVPALFVASLILSSLASIFFEGGALFFGLILLSYLTVSLIASIVVSRNHGWRFIPSLFSIFPVLHLSYGAGFLLGLFRFGNQWGKING